MVLKTAYSQKISYERWRDRKLDNQFSSVQSLSRAWLCDPMDCSTPDFLVHHQLLEAAQTHVHWVSDAIQPSHPLLSDSLPCFQSLPVSGSFLMSQFFASGGQSIGASTSASVLPINIQDWFPLWMDWLDLLVVQGTLKSLLQHHGISVININTAEYPFFGTQPSWCSNSHIHTWPLEKS